MFGLWDRTEAVLHLLWLKACALITHRDAFRHMNEHCLVFEKLCKDPHSRYVRDPEQLCPPIESCSGRLNVGLLRTQNFAVEEGCHQLILPDEVARDDRRNGSDQSIDWRNDSGNPRLVERQQQLGRVIALREMILVPPTTPRG